MLSRLITFGVSENFFEFKLLGELEKSCCSTSKTEVIDYDKTKEIISIEKKLQQPKSADALKILPQLNRIDFIELKGFSEFISRINKRNIEKQIDKKVADFKLTRKIHHSLYLLSTLINDDKFKCNNVEREVFESIKKNYIVVVDIDLYQNPISYRLAAYAYLRDEGNNTTATIKNMIASKLTQTVNNIPSSSLENLQKPILLSCSEIDAYYGKILGN